MSDEDLKMKKEIIDFIKEFHKEIGGQLYTMVHDPTDRHDFSNSIRIYELTKISVNAMIYLRDYALLVLEKNNINYRIRALSKEIHFENEHYQENCIEIPKLLKEITTKYDIKIIYSQNNYNHPISGRNSSIIYEYTILKELPMTYLNNY